MKCVADQADRASFLPLAEAEIMPVAAVDRADAGSPDLGRIILEAAELADVDANSDGKISFEELLQHDLEPGF